MRNYKIILQYEGTRYQGWQKQESTQNTIQGKLEALLGKLYGIPIEVQGASRTDGGVHAAGQTANFKLPDQVLKEIVPSELMACINHYLPEDVAVTAIEEVPERFHSRLHAKGKTYLYRINNSKIPHVFDRRYVWEIEQPLDLSSMRKAADFLCGTHDFSAFTSYKKRKKSNIRSINEINIQKHGDELRFNFRGDGFLYHMVRILVGTLIEVGMGKREPEEMEVILESHQRERAGMLAPAKGLTLMEVHYL